MKRRVDAAERRARLGRRHGLAERLPTVEDVAEALMVLHATDPATVYLSALARMAEPSIDEIERALYIDRSLVRLLAMRRTLFVAPVDLLPAVERSSSDAVAAKQRRLLEQWLSDSGIADPSAWLREVAAELRAVLGPEGATARTITSMVPRLATRLEARPGTRHGVTVGATSRVLLVLALEGLLVRGRPGGAWTSRQHRWHLRRDWLKADTDTGTDDARRGVEDTDELSVEHASALMVRRWLATFGPATVTDLRWWTGWTMGQLRPALEAVDTVEVEIDGAPGLLLADDLAPVSTPEPWAALLPSLDATPMGWKERDWYVGGHREPLFDRSGNIGPTIWVDGRIVGGWGQRPDGAIVTRLLEDVGADHRALIDREVQRLDDLVGDTVVKPSFPTPLQRSLSS